MLLLSAHITPRLSYIVDFIGTELFADHTPITITTDAAAFAANPGPRINYSEHDIPGCFTLRPISTNPRTELSLPGSTGQSTGLSLLFETGIRPIPVECFPFNDQKAFFPTTGDFPFDLFAAAFYLLSRYEEYLPHDKDEYGRYAHTASLAWREGFLDQPLINTWLREFKSALSRH